ncbi:MAG: glucose sorbosone dehydrogenase [Cytophaga sp.]|nr:glucose sorbosone dehydrogenase [Cytophaga sp.]
MPKQMPMIRTATLISIYFLFVTFLASAQVYPSGFSQERVANNISNPTVMAIASDGRIFVAQQQGILRVIKKGSLLTTPFITLSVNSTGERGLIGIALDPDFATNHFVYLYYTLPDASRNRLSRFTANGDVAVPNSEVVVLDFDPLSTASNHNGGALAFGPDGKLYVAIGDNAKGSNAQDLDTYHGKILRINKDGSVPAGNPFTDGSEQKKRIWAYGMRNPYTIAFQPGTGKFYVNDVGQGSWEEVNDVTVGGKNYGWPSAEGMSTNPNYTNPVYYYGRGNGDGVGCAITGGTFFNPTTTQYPASYIGKYFIIEYCNNWINSFDPAVATPSRAAFATAISGNGVSITTGVDGNLYYLGRSAGALFKIVYNPAAVAPSITQQPSPVTVSQGETATFNVSVTGSSPLTYQWKRNNVNMEGATSATLTITDTPSAAAGNYKVTITNASGTVTSNEVPLTVLVNALPVASITTPDPSYLYVAGTSIAFAGTGTDAEDGILPASAFSWQINFHHDTHKHDQPAITGVKSGTWVVPDEGEVSSNVWYRLILTVTDSKGAKKKDSLDVHPKKSTLNFATVPAGLQLTLDGQPITTPASVVSVQGIKREVGIVSPQSFSGMDYQFTSWSQGGNAQQTITTPGTDASYTAHFETVIVGTGDEFTVHGFNVYPNPVKESYLYLLVMAEEEQLTGLNITDPLYRQARKQEVNLLKGENRIPVYIGDLNDGMYALSLRLNGKVISKRVLIMR